MTPDAQPECCYCSQTAEHCGELRLYNSSAVDWGYEKPEYICRECWGFSDTGPDFDDLPGARNA